MTIIEDKIAFNFDDNTWSFVLKYDEQTDFKNIRDAIQGTKGVDIIGVLEKRILSLIEIKDFRSNETDNKVVRFCFCKKNETLEAAVEKLRLI